MWKYAFYFTNVCKNSLHLKKLKLKITDDVLWVWFMKERQQSSTLKSHTLRKNPGPYQKTCEYMYIYTFFKSK